MDDHAAITRCRLGDNEAFRHIVERYQAEAIGQGTAILGNHEDALDAVRWGKQLRADRRFSRLTVLGHSEGSLIGMVAAQPMGAYAFGSVAGAGRPVQQNHPGASQTAIVLKTVPNERDQQVSSYSDPKLAVVPELVSEISTFINKSGKSATD